MSKNPGFHVVTTTRHYKDKLYHSHLLRRSYREGGKVKKETLANLTPLGDNIVALIRHALHGEQLVPAKSLFEVIHSRHHGHVQAVLETMRRLGFEKLIASQPSRERNLVLAMVAVRILEPESKLASIRSWHTTTLPELLGVAGADEDELYAAMDWLLQRQPGIEKKLAARHLEEGGLVLYDLSWSYFEGSCCPLAAYGYNRDGKSGKLQVNWGLLTNGRGCPVAISVFEGNMADSNTLLPQVEKVQREFGIEELVLVGDRGMISQKQLDQLEARSGIDWITALRSGAIAKLVKQGVVQPGLFDERNLFEFSHPDYPGERLMACRNMELARLRAHKRQALTEATARELAKVKGMVAQGRLKGQDKIGVRVGKVVNKFNMAKHVVLEVQDTTFDYHLDTARITQEAALDGLYVIRTSLPQERLSPEDTVRSYKLLSQVEQAFRSFKSIDLNVRPIYHHLEKRVRAHLFLCMLAYYLKWHMMEAWRPLLFADEDQEAKKTRDPVAAARRSAACLEKVHSRTLEDGSEVHSFKTLLQNLSTIVRNSCRYQGAPSEGAVFTMDTSPTPQQRRTFELLAGIRV